MERTILKPRQGPSIRKFLRYYVLVLLRERRMSARNIRRTIKRRSRENRGIRPSGALLVDSGELRLVLRQLRTRNFIEPVEDKWRLTAQGRDELARCENQKEAQPDGKERAARKALKLMGEPAPAETVLDVGAGEGFLSFKVAGVGYHVLGIDSGRFDYSKDSVRSAMEKARSRGGKVEFRETSVADLARTDESFDYVVTSQAMHCMRDQKQCLEAIHCLLKPGGMFLCIDFLVGLAGFLRHGWHSLLAISREEWGEMLGECGFVEPSAHKTGDYLVVTARKPLSAQSPC